MIQYNKSIMYSRFYQVSTPVYSQFINVQFNFKLKYLIFKTYYLNPYGCILYILYKRGVILKIQINSSIKNLRLIHWLPIHLIKLGYS